MNNNEDLKNQLNKSEETLLKTQYTDDYSAIKVLHDLLQELESVEENLKKWKHN